MCVCVLLVRVCVCVHSILVVVCLCVSNSCTMVLICTGKVVPVQLSSRNIVVGVRALCDNGRENNHSKSQDNAVG